MSDADTPAQPPSQPLGGAFGALLSGARAVAKQPPAGAAAKRKSGGVGGGSVAHAAASKARRGDGGGSSFEACPLCGRDVHRALLAAHASDCRGAEPPPAALPQPPAASATAAAPPRAAPDAKPPPAAQPDAAPAAPSAFAVMLASAAAERARAAPQLFCLTLLPSGAFEARWEAAPAGGGENTAPSAWRELVEVRDKAAPGGVVRVLLATNVPSGGPLDQPPFRWPHAGEARCRLAAGPLKSAVQKSVRRGMAGQAVRCAAALAQVDESEALRRLCIIAVEDAIVPLDHLPLLTWLMVAVSKRYVPCAAHWAAVLRAVHALAAVPVRDTLGGPGAPPADAPQPSLGAPPEALDALPGREAAMVRCLLLRASFGGLAGDVSMLRTAAAVWTHRFAGTAGGPPSDVAVPPRVDGDQRSAWGAYLDALFAAVPRAEHAAAVDDAHALAQLEALPPLRLRDVPPAAIDFHCSNVVTDVLADAALPASAMDALHAAGEPIEAFKRAMWHFRSGVNVKACPPQCGGGGEADERRDPRLRAAWQAVEPLVEAHSTRFIRRSFE